MSSSKIGGLAKSPGRGNKRIKQSAGLNGQLLLTRFKQLLLYLVVTAVMIGAGAGLYYGGTAFKQSSRVKVQELVVSGISRVAEDEISAYIGQVRGVSIFELDLDELARQLRKHPWVDAVTVRRRFPSTLTFDVQEYVPVILVSLGHVYVANNEGYLFKRLSARDDLAFPVLTGMDVDVTEVDSKNTREIVEHAIEIVDSVGEQASVFGRVEEVHFDKDLGWSVVCSGSGEEFEGKTVRIHLGDLALRRISVAKQVMGELKKLKRDPAVVWVDGIKNPDRIHIRLRPSRPYTDAESLVASSGKLNVQFK